MDYKVKKFITKSKKADPFSQFKTKKKRKIK